MLHRYMSLLKCWRADVCCKFLSTPNKYYIINNLGGNDNIISVTPKMSRVEFVLKNYEVINKDELKNLGVQGISKTSQKITLVVGNELAVDIEKSFKGSN